VNLFSRHDHAEQPEPLPFGEPGSADYWIEAMKRAFELGEIRAQPEIDKLVAGGALQPPRSILSFPSWFTDIWLNALAPYNDAGLHHLRMPY
jgi:hypothetical protein